MGGEAMTTPSTAWVICHTEAKTYKCTKFEVFCFSHFRDISGNVKFQHGSHDPDHCYLVVSCDTKSNNSHGAAMDKIQQASVIPEIWLGPLKFKMIQVTETMTLSKWFVIHGQDCLWSASAYVQNLNSLCIMKIWMTMENAEMGLFGVVKSHCRSSSMSPFDTAHTCSYSSSQKLYVCLAPFLRYSGFHADFHLPICFRHPLHPWQWLLKFQ